MVRLYRLYIVRPYIIMLFCTRTHACINIAYPKTPFDRVPTENNIKNDTYMTLKMYTRFTSLTPPPPIIHYDPSTKCKSTFSPPSKKKKKIGHVIIFANLFISCSVMYYFMLNTFYIKLFYFILLGPFNVQYSRPWYSLIPSLL